MELAALCQTDQLEFLQTVRKTLLANLAARQESDEDSSLESRQREFHAVKPLCLALKTSKFKHRPVDEKLKQALERLRQRLAYAKSIDSELEIRNYCAKLSDQVRAHVRDSVSALKRLEDDLTVRIDDYQSHAIEALRTKTSAESRPNNVIRRQQKIDKLAQEIAEFERTSCTYFSRQASDEFAKTSAKRAAVFLSKIDQSVEKYKDAVFDNNYLKFAKNETFFSNSNALGSFECFRFCKNGLFNNGRLEMSLQSHSDAVSSVAVLGNGLIASGSIDTTVKIWSPDGNLHKTLVGHLGGVSALAALPFGFLASGSNNGSIRIWSNCYTKVIGLLDAHSGPVKSLALLKSGFLASGGVDKVIIIWNTATLQILRKLSGHRGSVEALACTNDGKLASGSADRTIRIWDTSDGELLATLTGHLDKVNSLVSLSDGNLASGSSDGSIRVWNTTTMSLLHTINAQSSSVLTLAALPNGFLASGLVDNAIKIFNLNDGSLVCTHTGHGDSVSALAILPNEHIVSGSLDNSIRIWS